MSSWIAALPDAVTHPFAFIAYIVVFIGWSYVVTQTRALRILLRGITALPEADRKSAVRDAIGKVIPDNITAGMYLRKQRQQYVLIGYLATLLGVLMFTAIVVTTARSEGGLDEAELAVRAAFECATNDDLELIQEPTNASHLDSCWGDPGRSTFLNEVDQGWIANELHACRPPVFQPSARIDFLDVSVDENQTVATVRADVQWVVLSCNDQELIHCSDGIARYIAHTNADLQRIDGSWKVVQRREIIDSQGGMTGKQHCNFHKIPSTSRTPSTRQ